MHEWEKQLRSLITYGNSKIIQLEHMFQHFEIPLMNHIL